MKHREWWYACQALNLHIAGRLFCPPIGHLDCEASCFLPNRRIRFDAFYVIVTLTRDQTLLLTRIFLLKNYLYANEKRWKASVPLWLTFGFTFYPLLCNSCSFFYCHYFIRAAELGSADSCGAIVHLCETDAAVAPIDKKRSFVLDQVGAMRGNIFCRHSIGGKEYNRGNHEIGIRHWKIAAEAGHQKSLDALKGIFVADGSLPGVEFLSEESLENTLRACRAAQVEVYSEERAKHSNQEYPRPL